MEIHQMLVLSLSHITEAQARQLCSEASLCCSAFGVLVPTLTLEFMPEVTWLEPFLILARSVQAQYVLFDRDGPIDAAFPTYDWRDIYEDTQCTS